MIEIHEEKIDRAIRIIKKAILEADRRLRHEEDLHRLFDDALYQLYDLEMKARNNDEKIQKAN